MERMSGGDALMLYLDRAEAYNHTIKLSIIDPRGEDGREIPKDSNEPGLIAAGGPALPVGHYKDPERTARTFRVVDGRRYAFTGDWGRWTPDGTLQLLGRGSRLPNGKADYDAAKGLAAERLP